MSGRSGIQDGDFPYVWAWRARPADRDRKGMRCRVLVRGRMNSALVEFEDGATIEEGHSA